MPILAGISLAIIVNFPWVVHHEILDRIAGQEWYDLLSRPPVAICGTFFSLLLVIWGMYRLLGNRDPDRALARTLQRRGDDRGAAEVFMRVGEYRRALRIFKRSKHWSGAAEAASKAGLHEEAADLYRKAGGSFLSDAVSLYQRAGNKEAATATLRDEALWLSSKGRYDEAIEVWRRARDLRRAVHTAGLALDKGRILPGQKAFEISRQVAKQANDHTLLARLHEVEGDWARAARNWIESREFSRAARAFSRAGLMKEAASAELAAGNQARAVALRISHVESLEAKIKLLESQGQVGTPGHQNAVSALQEETNSLVPLLQELGRDDELVRMLTAAGRTDEAIGSLIQQGNKGAAAELAREAQLWDRAAPILEELGRWGEASDVYELAGQLDRAAECAEKSGEHERALAIWKSLGRTLEAARCQARIGGLQEALQGLHRDNNLDAAFELLSSNPGPVPDIPTVILDLASHQKSKGFPEKAIACLQRAVLGVALQPNRLRPAIALAEELFEVGEIDSARSHLKRVLSFDYSYPPALELKMKIKSAIGDTSDRSDAAGEGPPAVQPEVVQPTQRYEIRHELGRGGMGVVYLAGDTRLGRDVAIKVLKTTSKEEAARLETEARVAATLNHPGIVTIYDFEAGFDGYFIAMEYVEGEPLSTLLKKNPELVRSQLPQMLRRIARALQYAHAHNVIHRDLKPANILRTSEGAVKLLDFGIAARLDSEGGDASPVCGTPYYMAPEQIRGDVPSPSSDIYSLGATAFHLATGRPPFAKGNVINAHLEQEPPDPKLLAPGLDIGLAEIILTCLNKDPEQRFRTCRELGIALRDL